MCAIAQFSSSISKIILHDKDMKIPIFNTIYSDKESIKSEKLNINILNNLSLKGLTKNSH